MATISNPRDLFLHKLADILYAENELVETLPQLVEEASDEELRSGLEQHLEQTRVHVRTVKEVFRLLGEEPQSKECHGIEGLKKEHEEAAGEVDPQLLDSVVVSSAAATEHYEISNYDALIDLARALGEKEAVSLLEDTLKEEKETLREVESIGKRLSKEAAAELTR